MIDQPGHPQSFFVESHLFRRMMIDRQGWNLYFTYMVTDQSRMTNKGKTMNTMNAEKNEMIARIIRDLKDDIGMLRDPRRCEAVSTETRRWVVRVSNDPAFGPMFLNPEIKVVNGRDVIQAGRCQNVALPLDAYIMARTDARKVCGDIEGSESVTLGKAVREAIVSAENRLERMTTIMEKLSNES